MFKPNPDAQGVPVSATCRWCGGNRVTHGKALLCHTCDMVPLLTEQEPEGA